MDQKRKSSENLQFQDENWNIKINVENRHGTFEGKFASEEGMDRGYLWFRLGKHLELVLEDFSGVYILPEGIVKLLNEAGYIHNEDIDHFLTYKRNNRY